MCDRQLLVPPTALRAIVLTMMTSDGDGLQEDHTGM